MIDHSESIQRKAVQSLTWKRVGPLYHGHDSLGMGSVMLFPNRPDMGRNVMSRFGWYLRPRPASNHSTGKLAGVRSAAADPAS